MMDLKVLKSALEQLEEERKIPREKIIDAIEQALAAAYRRDYGKKGQIVRARFDLDTGATDFLQVKIIADETTVKDPIPEDASEEERLKDAEDIRERYNPEHHIFLADAKKIKKDAVLGEEIVFPLETKDDYGRIAAQSAKQVIIQRIREAEKFSVLEEYSDKQGTIISGIVQRMERGNAFLDLGRTTAILPMEEQIPGEFYRRGERIRAYLYAVEETPRGINIKLSRTHPRFIEELFKLESPEIANGVVLIKAVAREAGSRSKIAVSSTDQHVDPIGACVGQRGVRVSTVIQELSGEKIDIIEWSEDPKRFVADALSPARVTSVLIDETERQARVEVSEDQLSLAIGKGGQNVRLANKLTGWRIDIVSPKGEEILKTDGDVIEMTEDAKAEFGAPEEIEVGENLTKETTE
ncbi:MAG: N utilization substance protein A [Parcubacteria group bacterium LiPW_30]|nr:MAG: N utilization substance protein A [Parcubacteria group bacterium LiPW_30]